jgi:hypothetical protein
MLHTIVHPQRTQCCPCRAENRWEAGILSTYSSSLLVEAIYLASELRNISELSHWLGALQDTRPSMHSRASIEHHRLVDVRSTPLYI